MIKPAPLLLDIRPHCAARQAPLPVILDAIERLAPGQDFQLVSPFEPLPLYELLGRRGFIATRYGRDDGAWEIVFHRG